jgi:serine/threonine-protein kinase HipA
MTTSQQQPRPIDGDLPVDGLRSVPQAEVYKNGTFAGTLTREEDEVVFAYALDYLADEQAPPVAFTLPKTEQPIRTGAGSVPPFFAGLLPEGARLNAITAATRTSEDDQLTLLLAVGADTIGDVEILPAGTTATGASALISEQDIATASLSDTFDRLVAPTSHAIDRVALPGVQVKLSAQMMSTPLNTAEGPAILKLNPPGYPKLVENEAFFLAMAAAAELQVPAFRLVTDREGETGLLIARFDRISRNRRPVISLPQEDACQVMGRYPAAKYRIKYEDAVRALAAAVELAGGSAALAIRQALELAAFSYLIGNGDLHGKNISIHRTQRGVWQLTPAYDLLSTQPYLSFHDPMALQLYGRANRLRRRWWQDAAERLGIPARALERRLDHIAEVGENWADRIGQIGLDDKATSQLERMVRVRAKELRATT